MSGKRLDFSKSIKEALAKKEAEEAEKLKQVKEQTLKTADHELEYALTVLLVELASSDQNFDQDEYHTICIGLERIFGTDRNKAKELINRATVSIAQVRGTTPYARLLKNSLPLEKRHLILDLIDELIDADGEKDPFEIYHQNRIRRIILPESLEEY